LVELLVSVLIISVAVAFSTLVVGAIKTTRDSTYENVAFHIANAKLDELRALGYSALPAAGAFSDPQLASIPEGQASTSLSVWNAETTKAAVDVSWRSANGSTRIVSLTTLITKTGGL
jgi:Tfp pilus assembly protein PilV